jgi:hypothetical protein
MHPNIRIYVKIDDRLYRLPGEAYAKRRPIASLAGKRVQTIQVLHVNEGGRLAFNVQGLYFRFNDQGYFEISNDELREAMEAVELKSDINEQRRKQPVIAIADQYRRAQQYDRETKWEPSRPEIDEIRSDLLGSKRPAGTKAIPLLK